ncbi:MAG: cytochrome c peroxidase [Nautiliaceae bacterium]
MRGIVLIFIVVFAFGFNKKALLGKELFFDKDLSLNRRVSCESCHKAKYAGGDGKRVSVGIKRGYVNSLVLFNSVFNCCYFWNGRRFSLRKAIKDAFFNSYEMGMTKKLLLKRASKYKTKFIKIYGDFKEEYIYDAIYYFLKELVSLNSKFDKSLRGEVNLTKSEERVYFLFKKYGCVTCHNGINFGGNSFQKLGVFLDKITIPRIEDLATITKQKSDIYVYRVPILRNIAKSAPYFHDGSVKSLKKAIILMGEWNIGIKISDKDASDIEAFLKALSGEEPKILKEGK